MSQRDAVFYCVCLCDSYYNYVSLQRQNLAVHCSDDQHASFITFITHGRNRETSSYGSSKKVADTTVDM